MLNDNLKIVIWTNCFTIAWSNTSQIASQNVMSGVAVKDVPEDNSSEGLQKMLSL